MTEPRAFKRHLQASQWSSPWPKERKNKQERTAAALVPAFWVMNGSHGALSPPPTHQLRSELQCPSGTRAEVWSGEEHPWPGTSKWPRSTQKLQEKFPLGLKQPTSHKGSLNLTGTRHFRAGTLTHNPAQILLGTWRARGFAALKPRCAGPGAGNSPAATASGKHS